MPVAVGTRTMRPGEHLVDFYESDGQLARRVGECLTNAVRSGSVAIVIATEGHRMAFAEELAAHDVDPQTAQADGFLILLDAATTMDGFIHDGVVEAGAFRRVVGAVVRDACQTGRPVCAYGEMVALLWEAGDVLAAIELEKLWNQLQHEFEFSLLCAYRSESVQGAEHADALEHVCKLHTDVLSHVQARRPLGEGARVSRDFPAGPQAPGDARHFALDALRDQGFDRTLVEDTQLVVTELATNAVVHAGSGFGLKLRSTDRGVRICIRDSSPDPPVVRSGDVLSLSGRGLRIVDAIAADWGVQLAADGKLVWAELSG